MSDADDYMKESARILAENFRPETTVHLAIDFQKGYCQPESPTPQRPGYYDQAQASARGVVSLSSQFRTAGVHNVWVQHVAPALKEQELCVPVDDADGSLSKAGFDSFKGTKLADDLKARGANTLILTGGKNDTCVAATALSAARAGLQVFIVQDMTYGQDLSAPEGLATYCEDRAGDNILVVTAEQVRTVLNARKAPGP